MTPKQMLASEIIEEVKRVLADLPETPAVERVEVVEREFLGMRTVTLVFKHSTLTLTLMEDPQVKL